MARAFWFSLLIGYLAGAFAVAIYLPRAILAPSLSNLLILTAFSALFIVVVTWRAWREREPAGADHRSTVEDIARSQGASPQTDEMLLDRPLAQTFSAGHDLIIDDDLPAVNRTAPTPREPLDRETPQTRSRSRTRVRIDPPKPGRPEVICMAEPMMLMPNRRLVGRCIQAHLAEEMDKTTRHEMITRGLSDDSILEFDRIVWSRLHDWLHRRSDSKGLGRDLLIDAHLAALRSRKFRSLIDAVVQKANQLEIRLSIVIDVPKSQSLPSLNPKSIGKNVSCFLRMGSSPPPIELVEAGFHGVVIDHGDVVPYLQMPLDDDPVFKNLTALAGSQARIVMRGFASEAALRDVFDYPCDWASGPLFGDSLAIIAPAERPETGLSFDALRGQAGYQFASSLDDR